MDGDAYTHKHAFVKHICLKSVYISFLQISNVAKEKYEISPMALILTFYKKLEQFFVENNIKLMIAHGINQKTTNKYVSEYKDFIKKENQEFTIQKLQTYYHLENAKVMRKLEDC